MKESADTNTNENGDKNEQNHKFSRQPNPFIVRFTSVSAMNYTEKKKTAADKSNNTSKKVKRLESVCESEGMRE